MTWRVQDRTRLLAAAGDLLATRRMAEAELGSRPTPADLAVYRVLGVRQAAQALVTARTGWRALGALVDVAHVATMVPVLLLVPRWRRAALVQIVFSVAMITGATRET